jgi:hypothetical protein
VIKKARKTNNKDRKGKNASRVKKISITASSNKKKKNHQIRRRK